MASISSVFVTLERLMRGNYSACLAKLVDIGFSIIR